MDYMIFQFIVTFGAILAFIYGLEYYVEGKIAESKGEKPKNSVLSGEILIMVVIASIFSCLGTLGKEHIFGEDPVPIESPAETFDD